MSRRTAVRDPWVWGQGLLGAIVIFGVPRAARLLGLPAPGRVWRVLGAVVIGVGALGMALGALTLGPNLTPATEPLPGGHLVTRGIYRLVRHPIYLGVSLALCGYALLRAGGWAGALVLVVSLAYFEQKARVEEAWLRKRLSGYDEYQARVPRILPGGWH
ncbi:MAG: isoprenylcysteine carboxylmethyltransferase family protein [Gemmatimonadota bacterium]|nr:isoprenylcysteine carboxylmethyltransferase family protein [Gemmatimonadota bacterium]